MAYATLKRGSSSDGCFAISEGNPPFFISNKQLSLWHLQVGQELDEAAYLRLKEVHERDECMRKALEYLGLREHTALELRQKLGSKGKYPKAIIESTIQALKDDGSLSESRYAEVFIRSRQKRSPEGRYLLLQRLAAKGVPSQVAREAVDAAFREHGTEYVMRAWEDAGKKGEDREKRLLKLQRKGFSYQDVRRALEEG